MEAIADNLESGGSFTDISILLSFLKKNMDMETLKQYNKELERRKTLSFPQNIDLLIRTIDYVIISKKPLWAWR